MTVLLLFILEIHYLPHFSLGHCFETLSDKWPLSGKVSHSSGNAGGEENCNLMCRLK